MRLLAYCILMTVIQNCLKSGVGIGLLIKKFTAVFS